MDELRLKENMLNAINKKIKILEDLRQDEDRLLARAKLIIYSCVIVVEADGKTLHSEENKMHKEIFKRYYLTEKVIEKYRPAEFGILTPGDITKEVIKYNYDLSFLYDLHRQLCKLSLVDTELASSEISILKQIYDIFGLSEYEEEIH